MRIPVQRLAGYRSARLGISTLLCFLLLGPSQIAQAQTNSAWRWGMWDTTEHSTQKMTPQAAAEEINGRGGSLLLSECGGAWLTFVYIPEKSFIDEIPQAPIPPNFKAIVL
jgi:hypothetical protein